MKTLKMLALTLIMSVATLSAQDSYNYSVQYDEDTVAGIPTTGFNIQFDDPDVEIQPVPVGQAPYWMLTSPGALRTYALSRVARGEAGIWGSTIIYGPNTNTWVQVVGTTPHDVAFALANEDAAIVFEIADPRDSIGRGAYLYDKNRNLLFYSGEYDVRPVKVGNSWRLPRSFIKPELNSEISIPVPEGTTGAKIFYRNDDGGYEWTNWNLELQNGMVRFPADYAGKGQLVLETPNGPMVIELRTGQEIVTARIATNVELEFSNYANVSDKGMAASQKLEIEMDALASDNPSDAPIIWVTLSGARTVKFTATVVDGDGLIVETPTQAYAFNRATGAIRPMTATSVINPNGTISAPFFEKYLDQAGDWIIWFQTESFNRNPYYPYYWGKG